MEEPPLLPHSINLLELPTNVLVRILEFLLALGPITLLGAVPAVCRRMRAVCEEVNGEFDLRGEWGRLDQRSAYGIGAWGGLKGALASAARLFPQTNGLWTFSKFPLHDACRAGLVAAAGRLLEEDGGRVDRALRRGGWTPLYSACHCGHLDVVRLLLEKGADLNKVDTNDWTALYVACWHGHLDVARLLAEKGADLNKADDDGWTPLYLACVHGHLAIAQLLAEQGADLDKADDDGATPLCIARDQGHAEIVALLKEARAE